MIPLLNKTVGETQDFSRYEFKYILKLEQSAAIEEEVKYFMTYDGFVHPELGNRYIVRSLYFDNDAASHYYDKIDGIRHRRKFRIRTYSRSNDPEVPLFLEEKGRVIDRSFKSRLRISPAVVELLTKGEFEELTTFPENDHELVQRFLFHTVRRGIKPTVLVDYDRRPYTSSYDLNFRVTFDSRLNVVQSGELFPSVDHQWYRGIAGYTILEVKFHRRFPRWFHRIIKSHDLRRRSISKFCVGMDVCGLARDLS